MTNQSCQAETTVPRAAFAQIPEGVDPSEVACPSGLTDPHPESSETGNMHSSVVL